METRSIGDSWQHVCFALVVTFLGGFFNLIAFYVLVQLYKTSRKKVQWIYLIFLNILECITSLIIFASSIALLILNRDVSINNVDYVVTVLVILFENFYACMIYLTLDRLALIILSFNYGRYWNPKRAIILSASTFVISVFICIFIILSKGFQGIIYISDKYVFPTLDVLFISTALLTYISIFIRYKGNRGRVAPIQESNQAYEGMFNWKIKARQRLKDIRKSFFFIPSMFIFTYVVFYSTPNFLYLFDCSYNGKYCSVLTFVQIVSYETGVFIDGIIYFFVLPNVRIRFKKILKRCCGSDTNIVSGYDQHSIHIIT